MTDQRDLDPIDPDERDPSFDPRLHAFLDGDLDADADDDFAAQMREDPRIARASRVFGSFDRWLADTREAAPESLRDSVLAELASPASASASASASGSTSASASASAPHAAHLTSRRVSGTRRFLPAWVWAGATAMAAAVVFLVLRPPLPWHDETVTKGQSGLADVGHEDGGAETARGSAVTPSDNPELASGKSGLAQSNSGMSRADTILHQFEIEARDANRVCLVGSFNRWAVCKTPLEEVRSGVWATTLELPRGRYEYMFVVDDRWVTDPNSGVREDDGFGNENAVLLL